MIASSRFCNREPSVVGGIERGDQFPSLFNSLASLRPSRLSFTVDVRVGCMEIELGSTSFRSNVSIRGDVFFLFEERRGEERRRGRGSGFVVVGEPSCYSRLRMANTSFLPSIRDICSLDCAPFPPQRSQEKIENFSFDRKFSDTQTYTRTFVTVQRASFELRREKREGEEREKRERGKKKDDRTLFSIPRFA